MGLLCLRHGRRAGRPAPRGRGARRSVRLQPRRARAARHFAGPSGRRGEGAYRPRRPVGDPVQNAGGRGGEDGRPDPRPRRGEHFDAGRQGALQVGRRAAHLPPRQHRGRSPDGDIARHPRRRVAALAAAALPALQGFRLGNPRSRLSPTCRCCSNPRAAASSRNATATRWASPYSRSSGHPPRRARPPAATARTATSPKRSSTCWRCWAGTPARNRSCSRCRS